MMSRRTFLGRLQAWCVMVCAVAGGAAVYAQSPPEPAAPVVLHEFLILPRVGEYGRWPIHVDPVQAAIVQGSWQPPEPRDAVTAASGHQVEWLEAAAEGDGWLRHQALRGGYAFVQVDWPRDEVMLLEAQGNAMVYVNGEPRAGDPYETGQTIVPVHMHAGPNTFLFHVARGSLWARLIRPDDPVFVDLRDATLPDLVAGESGSRWLGLLVVNAQAVALPAFRCTTVRAGGQPLTTDISGLPACSVRKIAVPVDGDLTNVDARTQVVRVQVDLSAIDAPAHEILATAALDLAVVAPDGPQSRTFFSAIDGSVQSYALLPALAAESVGEVEPGMLVTLHDAGVTAAEHLETCATQTWAHVLAPEGRRPHGFDWELWSARDVEEALNSARQQVKFDERRQWLAGTATGGHGVWHLATRHPDQWAAVAPRNAWLSYLSFGGGPPSIATPSPVEAMMLRAARTCDTIELAWNLVPQGVYLEHDPRDPLVPVEQSRMMRQRLAQFHPDFAYLEPRTGPVGGAGFVSAGLAQYLRDRHTETGETVELATFDLGASASSQWLTIRQQQRQLELSRAQVRYDAGTRSFKGTTENVAALALSLADIEPGAIDVVLDGQSLGPLPWPESTPRELHFARVPAGWAVAPRPTLREKSPVRSGNFQSVFDHRVVFVCGTRGDAAENAWALAKARFDAEQFLARANGSIEIIADTEFHPGRYPFHNVVLYGNADTNRAWPSLMSTSPVQVRRGRVRVGMRPESGDDLACVFVRPRTDSDRNVVAAVSGTGISGLRATDRLPYFVSGVTLPDLLLFGSRTLNVGNDDVRAVGNFGNDWSVESAEIVWRDAAL